MPGRLFPLERALMRKLGIAASPVMTAFVAEH
jgi:hypothetical protein